MSSKPDKGKQPLFLAIIIVLALSVGFGVSFVLSQKAEAPEPSKTSKEAPSGSNNQPRLADKNGKPVYEIQLKKSNKEPIDLVIKIGDYVQFNSKDGGEHQIIQGLATNTEHGDTSPSGNDHAEAGDSRPAKEKALDSGVLKGDEGFLLQFNTQGKYEFHDNYDHDYTISILVYNPNAPQKIQ